MGERIGKIKEKGKKDTERERRKKKDKRAKINLKKNEIKHKMWNRKQINFEVETTNQIKKKKERSVNK